jgi:hypothetical protein
MRKPVKIAAVIVGLFLLAGIVGAITTSLRDDSAPAAVSQSVPSSRSNQDRVAVLNREAVKVSVQGQNAVAQVEESGDPCSAIPVFDAQIARLGAIGVELRALGAPNPKLEAIIEGLEDNLNGLREACS